MLAEPGPMSDDDSAALGPAPTVAAGSERGDEPRPRRRLRLPRRGGRLVLPIIVIAAIVLLAVVPFVASSFKKTPRNMVGLSYGGGPFESAHFQQIVMPGSKLVFNGFFDPLDLSPAA